MPFCLAASTCLCCQQDPIYSPSATSSCQLLLSSPLSTNLLFLCRLFLQLLHFSFSSSSSVQDKGTACLVVNSISGLPQYLITSTSGPLPLVADRPSTSRRRSPSWRINEGKQPVAIRSSNRERTIYTDNSAAFLSLQSDRRWRDQPQATTGQLRF